MPIPTSYPGAPPLAAVFAMPSPDQYALNQAYWDAYKAEQAHVANDCPSATNIPTLTVYDVLVVAAYVSPAPWNTGSDGRNQCLNDAADWEWVYNPNSGHNKVF